VAYQSGGGIGGLSLALMLSKYAADIKVDVYEATARYSEVGAGLGLTWRSRRIVNELGLADDITAIGGQLDSSLRMLVLFPKCTIDSYPNTVNTTTTFKADQTSLEVLPVDDDPNGAFMRRDSIA
jgi:hypothetical protein